MRCDRGTPLHLDIPCTLTQADFDRFAQVSGDHNPIHVDAQYAQTTAFGATVSHGMLLFSRLRGVMERACPGMRLQQQELMFPAPSYEDEQLNLVLDGALDGQGVAQIRTQVHKSDGRLGMDGRACLVAASVEEIMPALAVSGGVPGADSMALPADFPRFSALRVGDVAEVRRAYSAADLAAWTVLAQMPEIPAQVPEPLIAALYSYLLGEQLPGHGTDYLKQSLRFHALAEVDEPLHAKVCVTGLRADKALVNLQTHCYGADGRLLCSGQALVLFRC